MLISLLREAAGSSADVAMVLSANGAATYASCLDRSNRMAAGLTQRGIERFACVVDDVADLIAVLCASSAVGAEACVYSATLDGPAITALAERFDHQVMITDRPAIEGMAIVTIEELADATNDAAALPDPPERAPALILTTGTTGKPKGARHDWARLAAGVRRDDRQRGARWLLAYNLNQFAGIQVLLHVLTNQATLVVPTSNQPRAALEAMRDVRRHPRQRHADFLAVPRRAGR